MRYLLLLLTLTGCVATHLTDLQRDEPRITHVTGPPHELSQCVFRTLDEHAARDQAIVYQWREDDRIVAYTPTMDYFVFVVIPSLNAAFDLRFTPTQLEYRGNPYWFAQSIEPALAACTGGG